MLAIIRELSQYKFFILTLVRLVLLKHLLGLCVDEVCALISIAYQHLTWAVFIEFKVVKDHILAHFLSWCLKLPYQL